ncbi:hypothetical protein ADL26_07390, partial [Thermoactinomyces vulgaris]
RRPGAGGAGRTSRGTSRAPVYARRAPACGTASPRRVPVRGGSRLSRDAVARQRETWERRPPGGAAAVQELIRALSYAVDQRAPAPYRAGAGMRLQGVRRSRGLH